jgi:hypothetical protein
MRLRQIYGGAGGEGALDLAARGSAVVFALGRDLDGEPRAGEGQRLGE